MEPHHGRRGKEIGVVCGINRANKTTLLMLAMVASTIALALLWEASPFIGSDVVHWPVLKTVFRSELEPEAKFYESRPFLKTPPLEKPDEGSVDLPENEAKTKVTEDETPPVKPSEKSTKSKETAADAFESGAPSEEPWLAETEIALAENLTLSSEHDLIMDVDLDRRPTAEPSSEDALVDESAAKAANLSSAVGEEVEGEASPLETEGDGKKNAGEGDGKKKAAECDYSVGKWVLDETRPLYSGLECEMWLSPGFSCRRNNHPDPLLDRYRWQPAGCDLPEFNVSGVLETLRNKVLAFVGDSLSRQQLQSLLCMLTRGKNDTSVSDVGSDFGFFTPPGGRKPNGFAYRFDATNTTIMYKWSVTLARIQPLNVTDRMSRNALHLDRPEQFIEDSLPILDILVLSSRHHWNTGKMRENRFDFYLQGELINNSSAVRNVAVAYNTTIHNIVHWVSNATHGTDKVVYYRSLSPRHFRNGDWNTGGTCDAIHFENGTAQEGDRLDPNAESAVLGTNVNLLNITSLSLERGETHVSKYGGQADGQDCLHWCLPGIPDTWNEILFAELATKFKRRSSST